MAWYRDHLGHVEAARKSVEQREQRRQMQVELLVDTADELGQLFPLYREIRTAFHVGENVIKLNRTISQPRPWRPLNPLRPLRPKSPFS